MNYVKSFIYSLKYTMFKQSGCKYTGIIKIGYVINCDHCTLCRTTKVYPATKIKGKQRCTQCTLQKNQFLSSNVFQSSITYITTLQESRKMWFVFVFEIT